MAVLRVDNLCKYYAYRKIFENISFEISDGERVALVGPNGIGKTTILRILCGEETADAGRFVIGDGFSIGYVPQSPSFAPGATLEDELATLPPECPIEVGMKRFGFRRAELAQDIATMSGGQKTRLALLRVWTNRPRILILDEPTNHLDTVGQDWLESFMRTFDGTILIVSHDRYFLDKVATRVIELTPEGVSSYQGNYTSYRLRKEELRRVQQEQWEDQEREAKRLEQAIQQQLKWFHVSHRDAGKTSEVRMGVKEYERARAARIAVRAKCTIKRLERMITRGVDRPKDDPVANLRFVDADKTGRRIVVAQSLSKAYDRTLFENASFSIMRGDKVGLVGPNASGKTTLLRIILGHESPTSGSVWASDTMKVGYMDQEFGNLPTGQGITAFQAVLDVTGRTDRSAQIEVRNMLGSLLLRGEDVMKPVDVLSFGERMRLVIARLLLSDYNVLVLDEPTNHLDLPTREKLEEALEGWGGTLILVSHDRYLVDRVCNRILSIEDHTARMYLGNYSHYLHERSRRASNERSLSVRSDKRALRDELLLLQNRLAVLSAELGYMSKSHPDYPAKEVEFMRVTKAVKESVQNL